MSYLARGPSLLGIDSKANAAAAASSTFGVVDFCAAAAWHEHSEIL